MNDGLEFFLGLVVGALLMFLVCLSTDQYKDGQVDALTGNVKYKLVVNPDSTKEWKEINP